MIRQAQALLYHAVRIRVHILVLNSNEHKVSEIHTSIIHTPGWEGNL